MDIKDMIQIHSVDRRPVRPDCSEERCDICGRKMWFRGTALRPSSLARPVCAGCWLAVELILRVDQLTPAWQVRVLVRFLGWHPRRRRALMNEQFLQDSHVRFEQVETTMLMTLRNWIRQVEGGKELLADFDLWKRDREERLGRLLRIRRHREALRQKEDREKWEREEEDLSQDERRAAYWKDNRPPVFHRPSLAHRPLPVEQRDTSMIASLSAFPYGVPAPNCTVFGPHTLTKYRGTAVPEEDGMERYYYLGKNLGAIGKRCLASEWISAHANDEGGRL